jgi:hypothetical protein
MRPTQPDNLGVFRLDPGGYGYAGFDGTRDVSIELLDGACQIVGTFQSADGETYSVTGVVGLVAKITPWNPLRDSIGRNDFVVTDECGGSTQA